MQDLINLQDLINKHENRVTLEACNAAIAFFEKLLSPNFGFQKRKPLVVNKAEFIAELKNPSLVQRIIKSKPIIIYDTSHSIAWVKIIITTKNTEGVDEKTRNHRLFTKTDSEWQMSAWYNQKTT
jgi:hypothetical protein